MISKLQQKLKLKGNHNINTLTPNVLPFRSVPPNEEPY